MNTIFSLINIALLIGLLVPLSIFLLWNWQYRHLKNGFKTMRTAIQHWVSSLFLLVFYITIRSAANTFGWEYPDAINRYFSLFLFAYLVFRTMTSMISFKRIRDLSMKEQEHGKV